MDDELAATVVGAGGEPYEHLTGLSPTFEVDPSGPLPAPTVLTFPLDAPVPPDTAVVVLTAESAAGPWTAVDATLVEPDRSKVRVRTDHLSLFRVFGLDLGDVLSELKSGLFDGITGDVLAEASPPSCGDEDAAQDAGLSVSSSSKDTVLWCLGVDDGATVLRVVNNRRYPLAIASNGLSVSEQDRVHLGLQSLSRFVSSQSAIIAPRETVGFSVDIPAGGSARLDTQLDGVGWSLYQLQVGVESALALLTRFGLESGSQAIEVVDRLADTASCADAMGATGGDVIARCMSVKNLTEALGWRGVIVGAAMVSGKIVAFFHSSFNALFDQLNGRDQYQLVVTRSNQSGAPATATPAVGNGTASTAAPDSSWIGTAFTPKANWEWRESSKEGYRYLTRMAVGEFLRAEAAPTLPGFTTTDDLLGECGADYNPQTDAIAPAALSMTNETTNFNETLATNVYSAPDAALGVGWKGNNRPSAILVAAAYSSGIECHKVSTADDAFYSAGTGWSVNWGDQPAGASTEAHYAYLILPGYFTPNYPDGDPTVLANAMLNAGGGILQEPMRGITSLSGPGVLTDPAGDPLPLLPLSGTPNCQYETGLLSSTWECGTG